MHIWILIALIIGAGAAYADEEDLPRSRDFEIPDISDFLKEDPTADPAPIDPIEPQEQFQDSPEDQNFILRQITLEGNRIFSERDLLPVYRFFLNKSISLKDLNKIARRIERFYTQQGWLVTQVIVPAQTIAEGRVILRVFEGKIAKVIVRGDAGVSKNLI